MNREWTEKSFGEYVINLRKRGFNDKRFKINVSAREAADLQRLLKDYTYVPRVTIKFGTWLTITWTVARGRKNEVGRYRFYGVEIVLIYHEALDAI